MLKKEDSEWLKKVYEFIIYPNRNHRLLNCSSWDKLIYTRLGYINNKEIQTNETHTVCVVEGVYIDLECNSYLLNFDWKTSSWNDNIKIIPINDKFPIEYYFLHNFYRNKASKVSTIRFNTTFLDK